MARQTGIRYPRPVLATATNTDLDLRNPPASPSAVDDEFTTDVLDPKWTQISAPGAGFVTYNNRDGSWLSLDSPGAASAYFRTIRQPLGSPGAAGTSVSLTFKMQMAPLHNGTGEMVFFYLGNNATAGSGSFIINAFYCNAGVPSLYVYNGSSFDLSTLALGFLDTEIWLHVRRTSGNVYKMYVSPNGMAGTWRRVLSVSKTFNFDYIHLTVAGFASANQPSRASVDFVRMNDSRFDQLV